VTVNPLVAARVDQPKSACAGVWIAEDIELIAQGVETAAGWTARWGWWAPAWTGWRWCPIQSGRSFSTGFRG
jgi:hypothetical protein